MSSFFLVCYIITLVLAVMTLITGIFVASKRSHTVKILSKAIRLFLKFCCFPCFFGTTICSICISICYLLFHTEAHYLIDICRQITTFCNQSIRNAFTFVIIERIVATIKLESYSSAIDKMLFWKLSSLSCIASFLFMGYHFYSKLMPATSFLFNSTNYYIYFIHMFMLGVCIVLFHMNKRMYKLTAYKINLKRRYTIAQNIKSLTYLFPTILIYAICAQFGSMINIIFQALNLPTPPVGIFHIFFNISYLLIYSWLCFKYSNNNNKITKLKNVAVVKNPLGKNIPTNLTADEYFHDLKHQWK